MSLIPFAGAVQKFNRQQDSGGEIGPDADYQIERSLRFNSADSAYLNRTPASAGNRKTWTMSLWMKLGVNSGNQRLFGCHPSVNDLFGCYIGTDAKLNFWGNAGGAASLRWTANAVLRDYSAWYHLVVQLDTTQATSTNRIKVWINNELQTTSSYTAPSQNADLFWNSANAHWIGRSQYAGYLNAYLTEINFIDGSALDPTSFGEFNTDTGVWQPIEYTGSYGTNGFYLDFSDNTSTTTLGYDAAGSNDWTLNNFSVTAGAGNDSLVDTPTPYGTDTRVGGEVRGNYCTLNPLSKTSPATISNGNLGVSTTSSSASISVVGGTLGVSSGKWYWEVVGTAVDGGRMAVNVCDADKYGTALLSSTGAYGYVASNGNKIQGDGTNWYGSSSAYGSTWTTNDVIGVALDLDNGKIWFSKNGTWQASGDPVAGTNAAFTGVSGNKTCGMYLYTENAETTAVFNLGQRPFAYTAPSGFKAFCTRNLIVPSIVDGGDYFTPYLYTADGTSPKSRTGIGFAPDFLWFKSRSTTFSHALYDQVRGTNKGLQTNTTAAENSYTLLSTFGSDGFTTTTDGTVGNILNDGTNTYVVWAWKANGAGVTNNDGTITSTVSANPDSGFSIVTYTGNGSANQTIGHGLGVAPAFGILKDRDTNSNNNQWQIFHIAAGDKYGYFTTAAFTGTAVFYPTSGSSTTVTIARNSPEATTNESGDNYVMYLFAPVAGYSAFGSYTGNGSADGPFVYTGFRPAFVLRKCSSATGDWFLIDATRSPYNVALLRLSANTSDAESSGANSDIDILSNGFKIRAASTAGVNQSGQTHIYMAFAENPFKYSLAR